jgi:glycosyltransferase involved in cell wall biosynthesis
VPLEIQIHGLEKFGGVRKLIAEFVLRRADKIRVVSQRLQSFLKSEILNLKSDIYVLPVYTQMGEKGERGRMGGKGERGERRERGEKGKGQPFIFLTVGRLVPVKNVALQIRAFARLVKEYPQIRLWVVGDGAERRNLQLTTNDLQLGDAVIFEGEQKDVRRFYEEADAFLLTSHYEGWGLAVTEAAGFGLPIIMTDVGLAGGFIKNNENGNIIPIGDEIALVSAMKRVIEDADLRARLGEPARASFLALPSAEAQIQRQIMYWNAMLR